MPEAEVRGWRMGLYAFDGTGSEDREESGRDTNVLDFFRAYDGEPMNDNPAMESGSLYLKGIGTRARTFVGDTAVEAFGIGGHRRVRQAIDRLENNIENGDTVVDVIGFSRGAALALSFANELAGKMPRISIRFMGLWDVVGQFGAPGRRFNAGHDLGMPPNVARCYHAMALDETRLLYPLTRLNDTDPDTGRLLEVWFRGVHFDVGGGNGNRGLNWISLNWMFESARRDGLPINKAAVVANLADRKLPQAISAHKVDAQHRRTILPTDLLHISVRLEPGSPSRPHNNPGEPLARIDDFGRIEEVT
jgi:uncharacterized protein (DUF2235 family)